MDAAAAAAAGDNQKPVEGNPYSPAYGHPYRHGVIPTRAVHAKMQQWEAEHRTPDSANTLAYGGGNGSLGQPNVGVLSGHSKVYLVFYGTQWGTQGTDSNGNLTFSGDPAGAAPVTQMMFKGIGTGGELWSAELTQWCDGPNVTTGAISCPSNADFIPYQSGGVLAGVWYDNSAASPAAATGTQLAQEALNAAAHFGNTTPASNRYTYYVILSPHGTNPDHYQGAYCAWHDWQGDGYGVTSTVGDIAFSNQPYNVDSGAGCGVGFVNTPGTLDGYTMTLGHEWHETMSDQFPAGGWTNPNNGQENSDECAWINAGQPGGAANVVMGNGTYTEQASWSNDTDECAISHADLSTPAFTLDATPGAVSVCAPAPATLTVNVGNVSGFNSPVTLVASGNPAPGTAVFAPNPVPVLPGSSDLTITTVGVAAGVYPIQIDGTASGAADKTTTAQLSVHTGAPTVPTLASPADAATGQLLRPTFTWTGSDTDSYTLDVATDAAFANIVSTQTVTVTTATPNADLAASTTYYWRVTPANACSGGNPSAAFSFTTANLVCASPALAIPDNNPAGVTSTLTVADTSVLSSLDLQIKATHTYVGDLKFTLSNGSGNVIVIDRPGYTGSGFGCSGNDIDVTLDDSSAIPVEDQCNSAPPALSGVDQPNNPLNAVFAGQSFAGTWTLTVSDNAQGDTGTLDRWCLVPTTDGGPTTYTVGGNVSGLVGGGLVLQLNGANDQTVNADGPFTLSPALVAGAAYAVTVGTQPSGETCTVANGSGTIGSANVTDVAVSCSVTITDRIFMDGFDSP